jgi:glutathione S-transferase
MLTVYGRKSSFNVQKVMWLIGELGLVHKHIELGGAYGGLDTPEFRAMNPHGRVPVVDNNGTIVWESHAILRYLAACYNHGQFWSEDAAQRSLSDRWMDWSQSTLQPDFSTECSGLTIALPLLSEIWLRWTRRSGVAARIFY